MTVGLPYIRMIRMATPAATTCRTPQPLNGTLPNTKSRFCVGDYKSFVLESPPQGARRDWFEWEANGWLFLMWRFAVHLVCFSTSTLGRFLKKRVPPLASWGNTLVRGTDRTALSQRKTHVLAVLAVDGCVDPWL